ncbi:uncharacterized protein LOC133203680 [Saccostrea echinata]|uniref:uncharacterized protein LOC133203680 n=1 Tax=Saccostrea echinata TaxID=191078 RepID=UPI002A81963E|nr:uncharacterized protein LOC133203680 [Saccostrea echinata]
MANYDLSQKYKEILKLKEDVRETNARIQNSVDKKEFRLCKKCAETYTEESERLIKELKKTERFCNEHGFTEEYACAHIHADGSNILRAISSRGRKNGEPFVCQVSDSAYVSMNSQELSRDRAGIPESGETTH